MDEILLLKVGVNYFSNQGHGCVPSKYDSHTQRLIIFCEHTVPGFKLRVFGVPGFDTYHRRASVTRSGLHSTGGSHQTTTHRECHNPCCGHRSKHWRTRTTTPDGQYRKCTFGTEFWGTFRSCKTAGLQVLPSMRYVSKIWGAAKWNAEAGYVSLTPARLHVRTSRRDQQRCITVHDIWSIYFQDHLKFVTRLLFRIGHFFYGCLCICVSVALLF